WSGNKSAIFRAANSAGRTRYAGQLAVYCAANPSLTTSGKAESTAFQTLGQSRATNYLLSELSGNFRMSRLEFNGRSVLRCNFNWAVFNNSQSHLLSLLRRLACRRFHSGYMLPPYCFLSSASLRFSVNCRSNMALIRSCRLAVYFLQYLWPFLVPNISPS